MNITIGAHTYYVASKLDLEAFCSVLGSLGPGALWPWLLSYHGEVSGPNVKFIASNT